MTDLSYNDDRMYVLEITRGVILKPGPDGLRTTLTNDSHERPLAPGDRRVWLLTTRRNVRNYPPTRQDVFESVAEAMERYKKVVVTTPRLSLDGRSMHPTPSIEEYTAWLKEENLFDPVLNPEAKRQEGSSSRTTRRRRPD